MSNFVILHAEDSTRDRYWKLYLDEEYYIIFETKTYTYKSSEPITDIKKWTHIEFHVETEKFYVGTYSESRRQITTVKSYTQTPEVPTINRTRIAPDTTMKIDELRIWNRDEDLSGYYRSLRGKAGYLDVVL